MAIIVKGDTVLKGAIFLLLAMFWPLVDWQESKALDIPSYGRSVGPWWEIDDLEFRQFHNYTPGAYLFYDCRQKAWFCSSEQELSLCERHFFHYQRLSKAPHCLPVGGFLTAAKCLQNLNWLQGPPATEIQCP
jgi:hypothetical protein